jgi:hypothetical protein
VTSGSRDRRLNVRHDDRVALSRMSTGGVKIGTVLVSSVSAEGPFDVI